MLSIQVRILLIVFSVFTAVGICKKIRKSACRISDALYWVGMSVLLIIMGCFPQIPITLAEVLGIESPVNFVYLVIIFLLLIEIFSLSVKVSLLSYKLEKLAISSAIKAAKQNEENKTDDKNTNILG